MIEVLAQITNTALGVIAVAVLGANVVAGKWMLNRLNSDTLDERNPGRVGDPADSREDNGGESFQTNVATPRARKIQPARPSADDAAPDANGLSAPADVPIPADSLAMIDKPLPSSTGIPKTVGPIKPVFPTPEEKKLPEPVLASAVSPQVDVVPPGALILGSVDAGAKAKESELPVPVEAKAALPVPIKPLTPATALPPLAVNEPSFGAGIGKVAEVPTPGRKFFGPAGLTASATPPPTDVAPATTPAEKDKETPGGPPRWSVMAPPATGEKAPETVTDKPTIPAAGLLPSLGKALDGPASASKEPMILSKPSAGLTILKPTEPSITPVAPAVPKVEPAGEGLIAIGEPVKLTSSGVDVPPVAAEETDDVKKKSPRTLAPQPPASAGLILIPPVEPKPEPAEAKAVAPVEPTAKPETQPAPEKTSAEPVLSPGVTDAAPATPPAAKPEAETKKGPRVFLPGKFFGGSKSSKEKEAAAKVTDKLPEAVTPEPAAKTEPELPKITTPPSAPALVVPPVEEAATTVPEVKAGTEATDAKGEKTPVTGLESKASEAVTPEPAKPEPVADQAKETPEAKPAEPSAPKADLVPLAVSKPDPETKPVAEKPTAKVETAPESKVVPPEAAKPAEPAAQAEKTPEPVPVDVPAAPAPVDSQKPSVTESKPPAPEAPAAKPASEPIVPVLVPSAPTAPAHSLVEAAVKTPAAPPAPTPVPIATITKPQPVMPENDTTTSLPNNGRASAQLTLAFEITSLQLTPFFKLGSVQLKALSNVVSLHLVAAQADNPLAAGISFQIEHVELDGASHLKSLLLKPLGESRTITAPLPKLQVDNVAVTGGGDGAPISITTSEQTSTAVQLFGTFTIAAMDFTPAFEIGSLRLEPNSNTVLLRVAPSSRPTALDLPPSFEIAQVQLGDGAQISGVRVTPSGAK